MTPNDAHGTAQCAAQNGYFSRNGSAGADVCVHLASGNFWFFVWYTASCLQGPSHETQSPFGMPVLILNCALPSAQVLANLSPRTRLPEHTVMCADVCVHLGILGFCLVHCFLPTGAASRQAALRRSGRTAEVARWKGNIGQIHC